MPLFYLLLIAVSTFGKRRKDNLEQLKKQALRIVLNSILHYETLLKIIRESCIFLRSEHTNPDV